MQPPAYCSQVMKDVLQVTGLIRQVPLSLAILMYFYIRTFQDTLAYHSNCHSAASHCLMYTYN